MAGMRTIVLPGIGGSGPGHWQSLWEAGDPTFVRFAPASWDEPDLVDWMDALDAAVDATDEPPLLLAHSLGTLLVAHWAARSDALVAGAFLVAVPDADGPAFPDAAPDFGGAPRAPLRFPSVLVASSSDPYASIEYDRTLAADWGSEFVDAGAVGHLNERSGIGAWPDGRALFASFARDTSPSAPAS
ncbi:serine hydrolase family protein [Glaciibacter flavus]|uniref:Serine hydrolase family protein n=2 Tax=Orlajensenia flava TaxID=2565934 RepID=A0A4S4FM83_9MICO|nr:serine hydrolase family protein [Glaciibacter flavus]